MRILKHIFLIFTFAACICFGQEHPAIRVELNPTDIAQIMAEHDHQNPNMTLSQVKLRFKLSAAGIDVMTAMLKNSLTEPLSNPLTWFEYFNISVNFNNAFLSVSRLSDSAIELQGQAMSLISDGQWDANTVYVVQNMDDILGQALAEPTGPNPLVEIATAIMPSAIDIESKFIELSFKGHTFLKRTIDIEEYDEAYFNKLSAQIKQLGNNKVRATLQSMLNQVRADEDIRGLIETIEHWLYLSTMQLHIEETATIKIADFGFPVASAQCIPLAPSQLTMHVLNVTKQQTSWEWTLPRRCMEIEEEIQMQASDSFVADSVYPTTRQALSMDINNSFNRDNLYSDDDLFNVYYDLDISYYADYQAQY